MSWLIRNNDIIDVKQGEIDDKKVEFEKIEKFDLNQKFATLLILNWLNDEFDAMF